MVVSQRSLVSAKPTTFAKSTGREREQKCHTKEVASVIQRVVLDQIKSWKSVTVTVVFSYFKASVVHLYEPDSSQLKISVTCVPLGCCLVLRQQQTLV